MKIDESNPMRCDAMHASNTKSSYRFIYRRDFDISCAIFFCFLDFEVADVHQNLLRVRFRDKIHICVSHFLTFSQ